jgi:uncharacterized membrane protein YkvA (DUF1232 family)
MVGLKFEHDLRQEIYDHLMSGDKYRYDKYLKHAPDLFNLLCRLARHSAVKTEDKSKIACAIGYFITPFDMIPENVFGARGYIDDICLSAYALDMMDSDLVKGLWTGMGNILPLISDILIDAVDIFEGDWNELKDMIG